jgi:hypothetical protein
VAKLKNNAARRDKIEPINLELIAKIRTYNLPEKMTEDDVKSVVSKLRACLDKAGKDAFCSGVSVTVQGEAPLEEGCRAADIGCHVRPGPPVTLSKYAKGDAAKAIVPAKRASARSTNNRIRSTTGVSAR